ncbi:MAG: PadR family transcriptional regulator [Planctomycetes bacterium]|nr:PadR family transcriptional regulator [Planctomycetota bacterium]
MAFGRDLLRGSLELMVLSDLNGSSRYGYQILSCLRGRSDGRIDLKAGTLYPILHKLERGGCVRSWWDDSTGRDRKWYALTDKGRRRLERDTCEWLDYAACVRGILGGGHRDAEPGAGPALGAEQG